MTGYISSVRAHLHVVLVSLSVLALVASLIPITSSAAGAAANLDQCVNGAVGPPIVLEPCLNGTLNTIKYANWVNGDSNGSKSHWREGDYVSYRVTVTGLTAGSDHTLTFHYDTVHGSKHALDFLGGFDATETTSLTQGTFNFNHNNPCFDTLGCDLTTPATPIGTAPMLAPTLANCNGSAGTPPAFPGGNFAIFGPFGSTVSTNSYPSENAIAGTGQCSTTVLLPFHVGSGSSVVLAWGGHIASQKDWGAGNSASAINGSPYHMFLDLLDTSSTGAQDRALSTTAIIFTPTISTTLSASTINVGQSVTDSATLTGASSTAGGTVTYIVYSNNTCTTAATTGVSGQINAQPPAVTVTNGAVPNSASVTFNVAGTYYFQASYSGDSNNTGPVLSICTSETVVVGKASPTAATTLHLAPGPNGTVIPVASTVPLGSSVYDSSTVGPKVGSLTITGMVIYNFFSNGTCTAGTNNINLLSSQTVTLAAGLVPDSNATGALVAAGNYAFQAVYSGDSNYIGASSTCENFTVSGPTALIAPTGTTCDQFANGTALALPPPGVSYRITNTNTINGINPGVFFYYTSLTAPASSFSIDILQSNTSTNSFPDFPALNGQVILYLVTGTPPNATCSKVVATITGGPADFTISVTGASPGATYVVGVKYNPSALRGDNPPNPANLTYHYSTKLNGALIPSSQQSVPFVKS